MGQGQTQFMYFHEGTLDPVCPKKKRYGKKKASSSPRIPSPAEFQLLEDWKAEIAASQVPPERGR
jgi:hypothetical protein